MKALFLLPLALIASACDPAPEPTQPNVNYGGSAPSNPDEDGGPRPIELEKNE